MAHKKAIAMGLGLIAVIVIALIITPMVSRALNQTSKAIGG